MKIKTILIDSLKAKALGSLGLAEYWIKKGELKEALKSLKMSKIVLSEEFDKLRKVV
jgi:hypothetical protein